VRKISRGYSISTRNKPFAGADRPAMQRSFAMMIPSNSPGLIFPVPVSIIVPTMALTMFLRNLSALMVNNQFFSIFPESIEYCAKIGFGIRMKPAETCKISMSDKQITGFVHHVNIYITV
jgi:hypothetical protein